MIKNNLLKIMGFVWVVTSVPAPLFAESKTVTANSHASISPLLELTISQEGQSELRFGNIRPSALDATEVGPMTILIDIKSNTGERYQVSQMVNGALENSEGNKIDIGNLKFTTTPAKTTGSGVASPNVVTLSPQIIFTSDNAGNSDTISAEYTLTVPPSQEPGDYSTLLTYTVSSL